MAAPAWSWGAAAPAGSGSWGAAVAPVALFGVEDALQLVDAGRVIGHREAHKVLSSLRSAHTVPPPHRGGMWGFDEECVDLTEGDFDWRAYLAGRDVPQIEAVVGPGIWRFEFRFLGSYDPNCRQNRADFVALRVDGTAVRLHPSQKKDAHPVVGHLEDWLIGGRGLPPGRLPSTHTLRPPTAPAASRGSATGTREPKVYQYMAPHDGVGVYEARRFLRERERVWNTEGGTFRRELTNDHATFPWARWLAHSEQGRRMLDQRGVAEFWLVWVGSQWQSGGFWVRFQDGDETVLLPTSGGFEEAPVHSIIWRV